MKRKRVALILLNLLLVTAAIFALSFEEPQMQSINQVKLGAIANEGTTAKIEASIYNSNFYSLVANQLSWQIYLDTVFLTKDEITEPITLEGNASTPLQAEVSFSKEAISYCIEQLADKDSLNLTIYSTALVGPFDFEFNSKHELTLDGSELMDRAIDDLWQDHELALESLEVKSIGLKICEFEAWVSYQNNSEVSYELVSMDLGLWSKEGEHLGDFSPLKETMPVTAGTNEILQTMVSIDPIKAGISGLAQRSTTVAFRVKGKVSVQLLDSPIDLPLDVPITYNVLTRKSTIGHAN